MTCSQRPRNLWPDLTLTPSEKSLGVFLCLAEPLASPRLASPLAERLASPVTRAARSTEPGATAATRSRPLYAPYNSAGRITSSQISTEHGARRSRGHAVTRSRGRARYTPRIIAQGQVAASPTRLDQPLRITSSQISTERLGLGLGICFRRYTGRITSKSTKKRAKVLKCSITKSTLEQFNPLIIKHTS